MRPILTKKIKSDQLNNNLDLKEPLAITIMKLNEEVETWVPILYIQYYLLLMLDQHLLNY